MAESKVSAEDESRIARFEEGLAAGGDAKLARFFNNIVTREQQTQALIASATFAAGPVSLATNVEFPLLLYWIHNPPPELSAWLVDHPAEAAIFEKLKTFAPATHMTAEQIGLLDGIVGPDGTIYGFAKYEQLDWHWVFSALNYAENLVCDDVVKPFPDARIEPVPLTAKKGGGDPVIGIIGDWGAGFYKESDGRECPAKTVLNEITHPVDGRPPIDYLIHLGDVYYAGTNKRDPAGEEQENFYSLWPDQGPDRNYTLNSNHEMYGRASGYFDVALQDPGPFAHQNGRSFFAMTYGNWLVLGLDSAYYSDAENGLHMYMKGAIGTALDRKQINQVENLCGNHRGPVMVLTHHDPCDTESAEINVLFRQVAEAIGRPPALWYWGHVHNGIVYDRLFPPSLQGALPTKGRCCGHGSIPFGNASGLEDPSDPARPKPNIAYYAHTPLDPPLGKRVKNGYALVKLSQDGGFSEAFYEIGNPDPVFQNSWTAADLGF